MVRCTKNVRDSVLLARDETPHTERLRNRYRQKYLEALEWPQHERINLCPALRRRVLHRTLVMDGGGSC